MTQTGERHKSKWAASAPPVSNEYITPSFNWNILYKNIQAEISKILRICSYNPCHADFEIRRQSLKLTLFGAIIKYYTEQCHPPPAIKS